MIFEIAVCDDCKLDRKKLIKEIQSNQNDTMELRIHEFCSGIELLNAMKFIKFSVVFLDIQMPGLDGEETAEKIREKDSDLLLVFITGFAQPTIKGFDMDVYRFIRKDMDNQRIAKYVKSILKKMVFNSEIPTIIAFHYKRMLIIKAEHIIYVEKYKKNTRIHIAKYACELYGLQENEMNNSFNIRLAGTLESAYEKLKRYGFGCPHSSYIINFSYMCTCTTSHLTLDGVSGKFTISRSKLAEFVQHKTLYMKENSI